MWFARAQMHFRIKCGWHHVTSVWTRPRIRTQRNRVAAAFDSLAGGSQTAKHSDKLTAWDTWCLLMTTAWSSVQMATKYNTLNEWCTWLCNETVRIENMTKCCCFFFRLWNWKADKTWHALLHNCTTLVRTASVCWGSSRLWYPWTLWYLKKNWWSQKKTWNQNKTDGQWETNMTLKHGTEMTPSTHF